MSTPPISPETSPDNPLKHSPEHSPEHVPGAAADPAAGASPRAAATTATGVRPTMWPLLVRLHFYAGVFVAPFLLLASLTGLAYAFTPQLDALAYRHELHVEKVTGTAHPLAEQVEAATAAYPGGTLATVAPPAHPDATTRVVLSFPNLGEKQRTVFVDPYTNQVRGTLVTWFDETPLTTWLDDLHRNLHLGALGRTYSEVAASWLWVLAAGGLVLWLGRRRAYRGTAPARRVLLPDRTASGVRRTRSWHATTGVWLAVGLVFLSATGLTWSRYAGGHFDTLLEASHGHAPELDTTLPAATPTSPGGGGHHATTAAHAGDAPEVSDVDIVLATARSAGLSGPVQITPPADASHTWSVAQVDKHWPVHLDQVAIAPTGGSGNGTVTAWNRWSDYPMLAKLSKLGVQAHMGILFGLANQVLLAAIAAGLIAVIVWGYRMWWQRRPTRADRSRPTGAPPPRGAWRRLPRTVLFAGLLVAAAVGWALPVLGATLLAFLAADALVALTRRRAAPATAT